MVTLPQHNRPMRGLVFAKYGDRAASTRQRFVQFAPYLAEQQITLEIAPLFNNAYLENLFLRGKRSMWQTLVRYLHRIGQLYAARNYDFVVVQYELFPYLPGFTEMLIRLTGKPVLYDIDDAIFHQYDAHTHPLVRRLLGKKLVPLLRWVDLAVCGNTYLAHYVARYAKRVEIIPTTIDMTLYQPAPANHSLSKLMLGWIGSPSTWEYFRHLHPLLAEIVPQLGVEFLVIGAEHAADRSYPFTYRTWEESREVADIQAMDIGIMPLPDADWARGKCGYKLIQYMACGLPVVASPVGVNTDIVEHGVNGFLATTDAEWRTALETLTSDAELRKRMGAAGRARVEQAFATSHHGRRLAQTLRDWCNQL